MSIDAIDGGCGGFNFPSISKMRQQMFKRMDQDGDGVISQSECDTAAEKMSQKTGLSITAEQMMSIFDLDQDGVITQAEQAEASPTWEAHMKDLMEAAGISPKGPPPPPPEMGNELFKLLEEIFAAMDTDGDGVISKTEYQAALEQLGEQKESAATSAGTSSSATASTSTEAAGSTEETSLSALLAQFLELLAKLENDSYSQYSKESQYQGMNSYA
jgi:Ca2+-binding EF-hand superfamily protein